MRGPSTVRVGRAAGGPFGPLGQVYGYWAPDLWPGRVALSNVASLFEETGRHPGLGAVADRAVAVAIGGILATPADSIGRGVDGPLVRALLVRSLGVIDHSGGRDWTSSRAWRSWPPSIAS